MTYFGHPDLKYWGLNQGLENLKPHTSAKLNIQRSTDPQVISNNSWRQLTFLHRHMVFLWSCDYILNYLIRCIKHGVGDAKLNPNILMHIPNKMSSRSTVILNASDKLSALSIRHVFLNICRSNPQIIVLRSFCRSLKGSKRLYQK